MKPIPKLEDLAGVDSGYGDMEGAKAEVEEMREEHDNTVLDTRAF